MSDVCSWSSSTSLTSRRPRHRGSSLKQSSSAGRASSSVMKSSIATSVSGGNRSSMTAGLAALMRVGPLEVTPPDAPSYRRLRAKKPSSARTTTMMMIQTMMLKTHLLWYALFCPVVSTVTHSGSRCLASSSSGSRRSTSGVNASSSKAIPLSGGLVIRNRRSRSWSSRRCQLLAVAPRSLVLGTACLRPQTTPGFRGRVLVGWLYLS